MSIARWYQFVSCIMLGILFGPHAVAMSRQEAARYKAEAIVFDVKTTEYDQWLAEQVSDRERYFTSVVGDEEFRRSFLPIGNASAYELHPDDDAIRFVYDDQNDRGFGTTLEVSIIDVIGQSIQASIVFHRRRVAVRRDDVTGVKEIRGATVNVEISFRSVPIRMGAWLFTSIPDSAGDRVVCLAVKIQARDEGASLHIQQLNDSR